jgi:hypothetical protein
MRFLPPSVALVQVQAYLNCNITPVAKIWES